MQNFELLQILLVFVSVASGCVSVSEFALLFGVPESITSSAVGLKLMQSLQEFKSIIQLSRNRKKNMMK